MKNFLLFQFLLATFVPAVDAFAFSALNGVALTSKGSTCRASASLCMANRRERRYAQGTTGKPKKPNSTKPRNVAGKPSSDAKWLQVLESAADIEPGVCKVVSGKYKGEDRFFALGMYGDEVFAVSEACGRCKFPMINAKLKLIREGKIIDLKDAGKDEAAGANLVVNCPLCGANFDMTTGKVAGEETSGLAQMLVSKIVSKSTAQSVTPYEAQSLSSGAIVVRVK